MRISGVGVVCAAGRGLERLEEALKQGWQAPELEGVPVYRVPSEALKDKALFRKIRRADRFTKMAVFAACDAVKDAGLDSATCADMGIILSTAFGPHVTTFQFLDDVLDYGEKEVSPTKFSHSVHNAAAFYVASVIGCRGPAITVTNFAFSFHHALILAKAWLASGRYKHILVGAVDESHQVMEYVCSRKLNIAHDGKIMPFDCARKPRAVPGEGSAFFVVSAEPGSNDYGEFSEISFCSDTQDIPLTKFMVWDADGMAGPEYKYGDLQLRGGQLRSYTPVLGGSLTVSALHSAVGALMLRGQKIFGAPVKNNPHGFSISRETDPQRLKEITCVRINCDQEIGWIKLQCVPH